MSSTLCLTYFFQTDGRALPPQGHPHHHEPVACLARHKDPTEALHLTVCGTVGRTKAGSPSYLLPAAEEQLRLLLRHRLECLG